MRESTYHVDLDGLIWHGDEWFDAPEVYDAFHRTMTRHADGRLYATCLGERCWVVPADTPFVVDAVRLRRAAGRAAGTGDDARPLEGVTLVLKGGVEEALDPRTLSVGRENVLYAWVRDGAFPARFSRKAYYEIARHIRPFAGEFALTVGGRTYPIGGAPPPDEP